ncbi:hypothetical protein LZ023_38615 (plasmid) [Pseudomonas silvicola]|nr:hypothetical protein LZ023_38615 [Pseudomonas silvicola]
MIFAYGTAAVLFFGHLFFPQPRPFDQHPRRICDLCRLLARPIGGIVFGHIGDKVGRKKRWWPPS